MKTFHNDKGNIETTFSSEEEKEIVYKLIDMHIKNMPKTYRKRSINWCIVSDLTNHGSGFSASICAELGVKPDGFEWVKKEIEE